MASMTGLCSCDSESSSIEFGVYILTVASTDHLQLSVLKPDLSTTYVNVFNINQRSHYAGFPADESKEGSCSSVQDEDLSQLLCTTKVCSAKRQGYHGLSQVLCARFCQLIFIT
jgi:hypothetical protein